jgi:purine-binding chemotaxis protein CheW
VPNTDDYIEGVVDLRGQITTILDPKIALDIDDDGGEQLLVVFGAETFEDQGHAGWIVDEVRQVLPITESEVKESPLDRESIKGVIERDDEFIIWTRPDVALEEVGD